MTRLTRLAMVKSIDVKADRALLRRAEVGDDQREDGKHQRHGQHPAIADAVPEFLAGDGGDL